MAAISGNITTMRRQIKNVVGNYSDAQIKVREATSNDPWGPSSSLMSEIADLTFNTIAFTEIMQMLWKRLNDHGKNWRHVYKSLVVLDYLVKLGSEKVAHQCRENIFAIQTLKDFQHIEDDKDQGINVREKAKHLVALLKDEERLKNERAKAISAKKRFMQNGMMGISFDGTTNRVKKSETFHTDSGVEVTSVSSRARRSSELEECRPSSAGEEELQLQIALALSREDAQKEEEIRKNDDLRLQMALNESCVASPDNADDPAGTMPSAIASPAVDDFFSTPLTTPNVGAQPFGANSDPWASSVPVKQSAIGAVASSTQNDPWNDFSKSRAATTSVSSDPWSAPPTDVNENRNRWIPLDTNDPFSPNPDFIHNASKSADQQNSSGIDELDAFLSSPSPLKETSAAASSKRSKTPADFLGENSALVNLDNLMGPSKPLIAVNPPNAAAKPNRAVETNPFLADTIHSNGAVANNPFASAPPLTLNQMKSGVTPPNASTAVQSTAFPPPQFGTGRPSSTNPFM